MLAPPPNGRTLIQHCGKPTTVTLTLSTFVKNVITRWVACGAAMRCFNRNETDNTIFVRRSGTTFAKRCKAVTSGPWLGSHQSDRPPDHDLPSLRKSPCSLNLGSHLPKPLKHNEKRMQWHAVTHASSWCSCDKTCNSKKFTAKLTQKGPIFRF